MVRLLLRDVLEPGPVGKEACVVEDVRQSEAVLQFWVLLKPIKVLVLLSWLLP